jgi:hypothetical protein
MTARIGFRVLMRLGLAVAAGATLFQTSCTLTDLLSTLGLSSLLSGLTGS